MGVLPRGHQPDAHWRPKIKALNQLLPGKLKGMTNVTFLDIGEKMLEPDGTLSKEIMPDGTHPGEKGYSIWGKELVAAGVRE
jgi:lysophospholipase L1-like esterase